MLPAREVSRLLFAAPIVFALVALAASARGQEVARVPIDGAAGSVVVERTASGAVRVVVPTRGGRVVVDLAADGSDPVPSPDADPMAVSFARAMAGVPAVSRRPIASAIASQARATAAVAHTGLLRGPEDARQYVTGWVLESLGPDHAPHAGAIGEAIAALLATDEPSLKVRLDRLAEIAGGFAK
jgi:hypothetical protein